MMLLKYMVVLAVCIIIFQNRKLKKQMTYISIGMITVMYILDIVACAMVIQCLSQSAYDPNDPSECCESDDSENCTTRNSFCNLADAAIGVVATGICSTIALAVYIAARIYNKGCANQDVVPCMDLGKRTDVSTAKSEDEDTGKVLEKTDIKRTEASETTSRIPPDLDEVPTKSEVTDSPQAPKDNVKSSPIISKLPPLTMEDSEIKKLKKKKKKKKSKVLEHIVVREDIQENSDHITDQTKEEDKLLLPHQIEYAEEKERRYQKSIPDSTKIDSLAHNIGKKLDSFEDLKEISTDRSHRSDVGSPNSERQSEKEACLRSSDISDKGSNSNEIETVPTTK